jgi:N-acetylneuraminic acid mutarotase
LTGPAGPLVPGITFASSSPIVEGYTATGLAFVHDVGWSTAPADVPLGFLVNGAVTIAGKIYAVGWFGFNTKGYVMIYDPAVNAWTQGAQLPLANGVAGLNVIEFGGKIYTMGGYLEGGSQMVWNFDVHVYDPVSNSWTVKSHLPRLRDHGTAALLNGKIYVIGGYAGTTVDVYDPVANTWSSAAPTSMARSFLSSQTVNGKIYVIGGLRDNIGTSTGLVEAYDPAVNAWSVKKSIPTARGNLATGVLDGKIYALGGAIDGSILTCVATVEQYDPNMDVWFAKPALPVARVQGATAVLDGTLYAVGGIAESGEEPVDKLVREPAFLLFRN